MKNNNLSFSSHCKSRLYCSGNANKQFCQYTASEIHCLSCAVWSYFKAFVLLQTFRGAYSSISRTLIVLPRGVSFEMNEQHNAAGTRTIAIAVASVAQPARSADVVDARSARWRCSLLASRGSRRTGMRLVDK